MLAGEGNYATSDAQMQYDAGLYAQIQTAGTKAWRKLPTKGDVRASLTSTKQGPDEPFSEFVHRLITAVGRIFGNADAGTDFVKQLAFENANAACQAAIRPYKRKTDLSGYIRLSSDIGSAYQQGLAMAAALQGCTVKQFLSNKSKNRCFQCGAAGHYAKDCNADKKPSLNTKVPGLCPRCKRGKHWASECKSKRDAQGQPLSPHQGNGMRGQPQAPKQKQIYGAVSFVPPTNNLFQTSVEPQQEVQDWTSVPPPTQY
uniref:endogenous retrovirus group K member 10 Gag polyprotein-like n=1 Tax=Callithrix jacchus TaxID=9483 RepID=UPI0023DD50B2|nr:endogenous retrovirus group K member 10 Gag polyprotein-like [Callithrix jacchus]